MVNTCTYCHKSINASEVSVGELSYHPECLICQNCGKNVTGTPFRMKEVPFCL